MRAQFDDNSDERREHERTRKANLRSIESDDSAAYRREYERTRKANLRSIESDESAAHRRENQRSIQANLRSIESDESAAHRRRNQRSLQANLRSIEFDESAAHRRENQRSIQANLRSIESDDSAAHRRENQRSIQANLRSIESDDSAAYRREYELTRKANLRSIESDESAAHRRENQRSIQANLRSNEPEVERIIRLKSRVKLYDTNKSLTSKRFLNIARSHPTCDVSDSIISEHSLGKMSYSCNLCDAKFWESEKLSTSTKTCIKFSFCCGEGKVVVPPLESPPELLTHLLTSPDKRGKEFRSHIRAYNTSLAFCSLRTKVDYELANAKLGVYTFCIHGVVHHSIGRLIPEVGEQPKFAQIYIHDGTVEAELENRQRHMGVACLPEMKGLQKMLHEVNPYVSYLRHAIDYMHSTNSIDMKLTILERNVGDPRTCSAPTAPEIAVLLLGEGYPEKVANRDIVLYAKSGGIRNINEVHRSYDSLHYVLLFPLGNDGWHINIRNSRGNGNVTALDYYCYRLMVRSGLNHLHLSGRLFHQYIVDMYAKIEQEWLNYIRLHQQQIRVDLYSGLADALARGDANAEELGRKVILPSSFIGSPKHMFQLYQDAMSIVRRYGKPDLFITFTCNPLWSEITNSLLLGQKVNDRPDLTVRVFRQKFKYLLSEILKRHIFGKPVAHVYTVEFKSVVYPMLIS